MLNLGIESANRRFGKKVFGLQKYGFIYKWIDKKRGRYYIGSHWGTFEDGYICSSNSMYNARKLRIKDFHRFILSIVTTNRLDLLAKEQERIDKIPRSDFGTKAYNVSTKVQYCWWVKGSKLRKATIKKLCASHQKRINAPGYVSPTLGRKASKEARRNMRLAHLGVSLSDEHRKNIGKSLKGYKHTLEFCAAISKRQKENPNRAMLGKKHSPETLLKMSASAHIRVTKPRTKEHRKNHSLALQKRFSPSEIKRIKRIKKALTKLSKKPVKGGMTNLAKQYELSWDQLYRIKTGQNYDWI